MEEGLKEGIQTKITDLVKQEAAKINGDGIDFLSNTIKYINSNFKFPKEKPKDIPKRIRTADELIESKIMTGCTDFVHLFLALCRAKGIPALYVETFNKEWLKNPTESIHGHIYAKVKINNEIYMIDPTAGYINVLGRIDSKYKIMCEGLDFKTIFPTREEYIFRIKKTFNIDF